MLQLEVLFDVRQKYKKIHRKAKEVFILEKDHKSGRQ